LTVLKVIRSRDQCSQAHWRWTSKEISGQPASFEACMVSKKQLPSRRR
jgi:hypothetical protein